MLISDKSATSPLCFGIRVTALSRRCPWESRMCVPVLPVKNIHYAKVQKWESELSFGFWKYYLGCCPGVSIIRFDLPELVTVRRETSVVLVLFCFISRRRHILQVSVLIRDPWHIKWINFYHYPILPVLPFHCFISKPSFMLCLLS